LSTYISSFLLHLSSGLAALYQWTDEIEVDFAGLEMIQWLCTQQQHVSYARYITDTRKV